MSVHIATILDENQKATEVKVYEATHEAPDSGPDTYYYCCELCGHCSKHFEDKDSVVVAAADHFKHYYKDGNHNGHRH